jgi:rare lipoprotein A
VLVPASANDVVVPAVDAPQTGLDTGVLSVTQSPTSPAVVDLGAAAATDAASVVPGAVTTITETVSSVVAPALPASAPAAAAPAARVEKPDERGRADTTAGIGWWLQLGAFKQRDGALEFQRRLIDEQPWLAPLLAVFGDHGLNKLQAGPYTSRDDARSAAERVRTALQLVPTIVEKR